MNSHEVFIHIHQGCFAGTGAIVRLPQCQWSKPDGHRKISQCITATKHSKAKTVCIFLGIYCKHNGCEMPSRSAMIFSLIVLSENNRLILARLVPSQWETALLCNDVSHWLGASLESTLNKIICMLSWRTIYAPIKVLSFWSKVS